jgi:hypothetical protein
MRKSKNIGLPRSGHFLVSVESGLQSLENAEASKIDASAAEALEQP